MDKEKEIKKILRELEEIENEKQVRLDKKHKPAVDKFIKDYASKLTSFDGVYLKRVNYRQFDGYPNTNEYVFVKKIIQNSNSDITPIIDDDTRLIYSTKEFNKYIKNVKMFRRCEVALIYNNKVVFTQDEYLSVRALIDDYKPITKQEFMEVFNTVINKNH